MKKMRKLALLLFHIVLLIRYNLGYNCTLSLCTWAGWSPWESCWTNSTQRRTRLACCPQNVKISIRTLGDCLNACRTMGLSGMDIKDAYIYRRGHCVAGQVNNTGLSSSSQLTWNSSSVNGHVPQYHGIHHGHGLLVYLCTLAGFLALAALTTCCLCYFLCGRKKRETEKRKVHPQQNTIDF